MTKQQPISKARAELTGGFSNYKKGTSQWYPDRISNPFNSLCVLAMKPLLAQEFKLLDKDSK